MLDSSTRARSRARRFASARGSVLVVAALAAALCAFAERQPYSRYETIVERQMFGAPPEGFDPTKPPSEAVSSRSAQKAERELSQEQQKLKSSIRFSMINVTPGGETAVGFTDSSDSKNPINYYLKVGETRNGWTVKEADPAKGSMTIVKDDVEVALSIGDNSAKGGGKTSAAGGKTLGRSDGFSRDGALGSLRARRNQRQAQQLEQQARMDSLIKGMKEREEAEARRREEESRVREEQAAEREEQRVQLQKLQEELRRTREERAKAEAEKSDGDDSQVQEQ